MSTKQPTKEEARLSDLDRRAALLLTPPTEDNEESGDKAE